MSNEEKSFNGRILPHNADPDAIDWYATGLACLRDHGIDAIDMAAAILQNALGEVLRRAPERRILSKETTRSPRKLALQAIGAFETAGGLFQIVLRKLAPEERAAFDQALRARGLEMLEAGKGRAPPNESPEA